MQLCAEVHNRLTEIRRRGKAISLKYMVRASDAPVETAKYMGHGVCDNMAKTVTLHDYTDDRSTIERTVFRLKNDLNVTPSELRGIGIQITKLDGSDDNGAVVARPINNALKMMFDKVTEKIKDKISIVEPVPEHSKELSKREPAASRSFRGRKVGRPRKCSAVLAQTSSLSKNIRAEELDMDVLAELPDEIRAEVLRDYNVKRPRLLKNSKKAMTQLKPQSNVDEDFLAALPADIRAEVLLDQNMQNIKLNDEKFIEEQTESNLKDRTEDVGATNTAVHSVSGDNIFIQTHWRQTLQQWLDTTSDPNDPPLQCDVNTVVDCAVELVRSRLINTLYLAMRFLHRFVYVYKFVTATY